MSRREQIRMGGEEAASFLAAERTVICATHGPDGWPHLMPLWYVLREGGPDGQPRLWAWTYGKSQKARNIERDARVSLQVEAGEGYEELRGVMLRCVATTHRDPAVIEAIAMELVDRYSGPGPEFDALRDYFRSQVPKRLGLEFVERSRVTWDHRKLAGTY